MKSFTSFIDELKQIYESAAGERLRLQDELETAQSTWREAQSANLREAQILRARADFEESESKFRSDLKSLQDATAEKVQTLRSELETVTADFYRASPEKLDTGLLTLLDSGIMSISELEYYADANRGNPTILRLIGRFAEILDGDRAAQLSLKLNNLGSGQKELAIFDRAALPQRIRNGRPLCGNHSTGFLKNNLKQWKAFTLSQQERGHERMIIIGILLLLAVLFLFITMCASVAVYSEVRRIAGEVKETGNRR